MIKVEFKHFTRRGIEGFLTGVMVELRNGNYDVYNTLDGSGVGNLLMANLSSSMVKTLFNKELLWTALDYSNEDIYDRLFGEVESS